MDNSLRILQRLAANGSADAQQRYIAALERVAGISNEEIPGIYQPKDRQWLNKSDNLFEAEPVIYRDPYCPMLRIYFKRLPDLGFTLQNFPEKNWDWLLGSVSSQVSRIAEKAYELGKKDLQQEIRQTLGLS